MIIKLKSKKHFNAFHGPVTIQMIQVVIKLLQ